MTRFVKTPEPETLGTELNIEGVRTEAQLVRRWTAHVLSMCGGNKSVAARVLGIDRRSLYRRIADLKNHEGCVGTPENLRAEAVAEPKDDLSCS